MNGSRRTRTVFAVPRMDCPSEEQLIRMALANAAEVAEIRCDLQARSVTVYHAGQPAPLLVRLQPLGLGASIVDSTEVLPEEVSSASREAEESRSLRILLAINAAMFVVEIVAGWLAQSTGLIADSLDMLADALVYGLSLYAVGRSARAQLRAAHASGVLQAALALGVLFEVVRRLVTGSFPEPPAMIAISVLALVANVTCLVLIARHRHGGAHMKASWIFSANDVLANLGVILAGALVAWTGSRVPDLLIGALVGCFVLIGGVRILRLR